ncbi:MAG: hypothetical protein KAI47_15010 [Deltaproteobacteria bacterium]|nr:hypothetical protein [Deltaproteobacteria bacterium]
MREARTEAGFGDEQAGEAGIVYEFRAEDLQSDELLKATRARGSGQIDLCHAASAEATQETIGTELPQRRGVLA